LIIQVINQITTDSSKPVSLDRGGLFGDGFFTTGIIVEHQFCHQKLHYDRLVKSAQKLQFTDFTLSAIENNIVELCQKHQNAGIRISISRRQTQRGYAISPRAEYDCTIHLSDLTDAPIEFCELIDANTSVSYNKDLAGIKHLNRLDSVLAASEVLTKHQEVLMYHEDLVICGSRSNLFINIDDVWLTPKLDRCGIEGITRRRVLKMFKQQQIKHQITSIDRALLDQASDAFVTNSLIGIWPAKSINGRALHNKDSNHFKKLVTRK